MDIQGNAFHSDAEYSKADLDLGVECSMGFGAGVIFLCAAAFGLLLVGSYSWIAVGTLAMAFGALSFAFEEDRLDTFLKSAAFKIIAVLVSVLIATISVPLSKQIVARIYLFDPNLFIETVYIMSIFITIITVSVILFVIIFIYEMARLGEATEERIAGVERKFYSVRSIGHILSGIIGLTILGFFVFGGTVRFESSIMGGLNWVSGFQQNGGMWSAFTSDDRELPDLCRTAANNASLPRDARYECGVVPVLCGNIAPITNVKFISMERVIILPSKTSTSGIAPNASVSDCDISKRVQYIILRSGSDAVQGGQKLCSASMNPLEPGSCMY